MIEKLNTEDRPAQWELEEKINEIIDVVNNLAEGRQLSVPVGYSLQTPGETFKPSDKD